MLYVKFGKKSASWLQRRCHLKILTDDGCLRLGEMFLKSIQHYVVTSASTLHVCVPGGEV